MGKKLGGLKVGLHKPYYVVGELVSGVVYVDARADLPVDKIYLKAKGKEKVRILDTRPQPPICVAACHPVPTSTYRACMWRRK